ncbi:MAG: hypothetical protein LUD72_04250 [Bacteroidales bacterium]|nr:hypothetical protein [Bacteroidales bacterium]
MENLPYIYTMDELEGLIARWGFLPFFRNRAEGFSIQDVMDEERVFNDGPDCAWKWKSAIISHGDCVYGKFFADGRAGYIHLKWLPDFMNWRRAAYPLETFPEEARRVLEVLRTHESMSSRLLKRECGFSLGRRRRKLPDPTSPTGFIRETNTGADFNALISRLQVGAYVCIADFEPVSERRADSGWTLSVYTTVEAVWEFATEAVDFFGGRSGEVRAGDTTRSNGPSADAGAGSGPLASAGDKTWRDAVEGRTPEQSRERILNHLRGLFPATPDKVWEKLI